MQQTAVSGPACPECAGEVLLGPAATVSEIVECSDCLSELEVLSVTPPQLALAPEVEEDWGE